MESQDPEAPGRIYEIPSDEETSEIALKQHMIQSQSVTGDFKDIV